MDVDLPILITLYTPWKNRVDVDFTLDPKSEISFHQVETNRNPSSRAPREEEDTSRPYLTRKILFKILFLSYKSLTCHLQREAMFT